MFNKISNSIKRSLEIFLISASLNCLYSAKPKINYPLEIGGQRFEKIGNIMIYMNKQKNMWFYDNNYKPGDLSFDEVRFSSGGPVSRGASNESVFIRAGQEARELLEKALRK